VRAREYTGPLGILAAGAIGLSLLCSVSAMAMGDLNRYVPRTFEPINLVDLAVANFETAAALTEQMVTVFVPTETLAPTSTPVPASLTPQPTDTERRFVTITPTIARRTRVPSTPVIVASRTPTSRPPTRTPLPPTRTNTPIPPPTDTNTPIPPPTDTNTPIPPPTDTNTPIPPPTDPNTPIPPPTATDPPVDIGPSVEPAPFFSPTPP
jgi:hypothetical protein